MRLKQWLLTGASFCLVASGCGRNEILVKKQTELEARLEQLIQANAGNTARLAELSSRVSDLQGQVRSNSADLEQLKPAFRDLKSSLDAVPQRVEEKTPLPASSRVVVVNKETAPGDGQSTDQDAYMKAYGLFSSNQYSAAIEAFEAFIKDHPRSEYSGNAQYWIGECHYSRRDYARALEAFNRVVEKYPKGKKVPDALLKIGFSQISLNEPEKARATLEAVVEKYPRSPAAAKARERLSR
jgi:tol-pal system protein YbgF